MSLTQAIGNNYTIDISQLNGADIASLAKWMQTYRNEIGQRLNDDTRDHLLKGYVPGFEPEFIHYPDFAGKGYNKFYAKLRNNFCTATSRGSAVSNLLPLTTFLYECYGLSPSKFILGNETQTKLPAWLLSWLEQVEHLSNAEASQLYNILESEPQIRADAIYVTQSRIRELAVERGMWPREFHLYPGILSSDRQEVLIFADSELTENGNPYHLAKTIMGNHKILRLLVALCAIYQVSPEYLILQDYSDFAVTEQGRHYPPAQRKLISMILKANNRIRQQAIGYVFAATAKRVISGECVPGTELLAESNADAKNEDGSINVLHAFTALSGSKSATAFEAEMIELLKTKILELISASEEPVSGTRLFQLVEGHPRMVRRALFFLTSDGIIERVSLGRETDTYRMAKGRKKRTKK